MRFRGYRVGFPVALGLLLLPACGGRYFEIADAGGDGGTVDEGGSPADAGPRDAAGPDDGGGRPDTGADTGPETGADADAGTPPPVCPVPATIVNGGACTTPGLDCPSAAPIYTCGGGQVTGYAACKCTLGSWACPQPTCVEAGAPPPPSCPNPKLVREAVACNSPGEDCPGNPTMCSGAETFYDVFQCTKAQVWTRIVVTVCGDGG